MGFKTFYVGDKRKKNIQSLKYALYVLLHVKETRVLTYWINSLGLICLLKPIFISVNYKYYLVILYLKVITTRVIPACSLLQLAGSLLSENQVRSIVDQIKHVITASAARKKERAERTKAEDFDAEEEEMLKEENEQEEEVFDQVVNKFDDMIHFFRFFANFCLIFAFDAVLILIWILFFICFCISISGWRLPWNFD